MGKSGNPAKRASSAADFKSRRGGFMDLPSGLTVKVHNKGGMQGFLQSGMIPNSLMGLIQDSVSKGVEPDEKEILSVLGSETGEIDEKAIENMMTMYNNVVQQVVVEPKLHSVPTVEDVIAWNKTHPKNKVSDPEDLRDDDLVYIDELDDEDKMFIFQWVTGGTRDVEQFRQESKSTLDNLAGLQSTQAPAKRASRSRR